MPLAQAVRLAIGIDRSPGMIETARRHAARSSVRHVRFACMDAEELAFPDGLFDAVICRHAPFAAGEAARVLTDGGVFITQQVSERDKWNVKEAFGRGQAYGEPNGTLMRRCAGQLKEAGFRRIFRRGRGFAVPAEAYPDYSWLRRNRGGCRTLRAVHRGERD